MILAAAAVAVVGMAALIVTLVGLLAAAVVTRPATGTVTTPDEDPQGDADG